jgi:hypothetical protein
MPHDWPKWADMNWLRLLEGPANWTAMDIAPTMKNLTVQGEKYFRMPDSRAAKQDGDPAERTECGGSYLWTGWCGQWLAEKRAEQAGAAE